MKKDPVLEKYENEGFGKNAFGWYFNPWIDEYDSEYDPHNDKSYNTELDKEEIKWHPELTQEQIDELKAEGIKPGDNEYDQYLWNHGINPFKDIEEKIESEKEEPEKTATETEKTEPEVIKIEKREPEIILEATEIEEVEEKIKPEATKIEKTEPEVIETEKTEPEHIDINSERKKESWFKKVSDRIKAFISSIFNKTKRIPEETKPIEIDENWKIVDNESKEKNKKKEKYVPKHTIGAVAKHLKSRTNVISKSASIAKSKGMEAFGGMKIAGARIKGYLKKENKNITNMKVNYLREKYFNGPVDHSKVQENARRGVSELRQSYDEQTK